MTKIIDFEEARKKALIKAYLEKRKKSLETIRKLAEEMRKQEESK